MATLCDRNLDNVSYTDTPFQNLSDKGNDNLDGIAESRGTGTFFAVLRSRSRLEPEPFFCWPEPLLSVWT